MESRRRSLLDSTRNNNFLRKSFCLVDEDPVRLTREQYMELLKKEKQQWKALLRAKQKKKAEKYPDTVLKQENVENLKDIDKAFANERPNYLEITHIARRYVQSVIYYNKLAADFKERWEADIEDIEEKTDDIVTKLLEDENELCLECDNGYCTVEVHCLIDRDAEFTEVITELVSPVSRITVDV